MITTRKKKIEATAAVTKVRRPSGAVWNQLVDGHHWLYQKHGISLNKGDAMALYATGGMTKRVQEAWGRLPF